MARSESDGVFTRKDRSGYWISWFDVRGRRRYRRTKAQTLAEARRLRSAEVIKVEQAKALGVVPASDELFSSLATRFLAHQKARVTLKTCQRESDIIERHLVPFFRVPVASIRRADVQRYITSRSSGVSAYTVQKELNVLKHMLRLAVEWEIIVVDPAHGVRSPRTPAGRVRYLQPKEIHAVLRASNEWLRPIVAFAVATGMRRSEILGLRWLDVDLVGRRVILPQTKNGHSRVVYLNDFALAVLQSKGPETPAELVFPVAGRPESVSVAFHRVCTRLSIPDFRFHDLRHTAASWLRMQGADIHTVAQLLGHRDLRMAVRYQHLSPTFLGGEVKRLDAILGADCYPAVTASSGEIIARP